MWGAQQKLTAWKRCKGRACDKRLLLSTYIWGISGGRIHEPPHRSAISWPVLAEQSARDRQTNDIDDCFCNKRKLCIKCKTQLRLGSHRSPYFVGYSTVFASGIRWLLLESNQHLHIVDALKQHHSKMANNLCGETTLCILKFPEASDPVTNCEMEQTQLATRRGRQFIKLFGGHLTNH